MYEVLARIGGKQRESADLHLVHDRFTNEPVGRLHLSTAADVEEALQIAVSVRAEAPLTGYQRADLLRRAAARLEEDRESFVQVQHAEAGFTRSDGQTELARARRTLELCADEAIRLTGRAVPLSSPSASRDRLGFTVRKPVGVVAAVTPFNSPVNTVCHKVGAAIAAGNAVLLKPSEATPSAAVMIADAFSDAGLPDGWLQVLHGTGRTPAAQVVEDPRVDMITFTGSNATGQRVQRAAGSRRVQLEMGSISCTVLAEDAELTEAVLQRCAQAAFRKAGQVCTSIQRLYVHAEIADDVLPRFLAVAAAMTAGDPRLPATDVGPLISLAAAERIESWIAEAVRAGAVLQLGGQRHGSVITPTVLENVRRGTRLHDHEVFGPVVCLHRYTDDQQLVEEINATPYGLATGLFTNDLARALHFATELRVGTLYVNGTSSSRVDIAPYGGLKDSGHGLEGPAYAVAEMTEETLVSIE